ncbi:MAG TPA: hypothetical protein PK325_06070 [Cyclobacteriaceae bacterium]|nr:hypothetical protein [Cyclobacteriaceae bacterium]HMV10394.1 hypothetical protein [Cyclobacteriaceae bacterium]HMV90926.1 hypothetical protein [Cyclobacteriaceae bacterium]HMX00419.1 hypothetical protein [Cyclobacteriaceae bacterium]HMX50497.1 hypothetical protein [Cyclobacteriaceae bacterium]
MKMKISVLVIVLLTTVAAKAQKRDSVTNEELHKYAVVIDSLETLKKSRAEMSTRFAKGNNRITPSRYTQLLPIIDDSKKLAEAKATADEIAYVKDAIAKLTQAQQTFQTTFNELVAKYVGYDTYNKVKKAIAADKRVKDRYYVEINRLNGVATDVQ